MNSLTKKYLAKVKLDQDEASTLRSLGEFKGRQTLFSKQTPEVLDALIDLAKVESTESSNRIEGVVTTRERVRSIVLRATKPRGRSEQEIAGYRDALAYIHENWSALPFDTNTIRQLHGMIYRYTDRPGGTWKSRDNLIVDHFPDGSTRERFRPVAASETAGSMDALVERFAGLESLDAMVAIPLTILDFLCIHPFSDGNGRVARLLTILLLYKAGYSVARYISLERIYEESKETYYDALKASSFGWHKGRHDYAPWLSYFWGVLVRAYKEFEERVETLSSGRGSKTEIVMMAIDRRVGQFSISDIEKDSPGVSRDMLRHVFHKLRDEGRIISLGQGRGAKWEKVRGKW